MFRILKTTLQILNSLVPITNGYGVHKAMFDRFTVMDLGLLDDLAPASKKGELRSTPGNFANSLKGETPMNKPLTPPTLAAREKAFKAKVANQQPTPLGKAPVPTDAPRIVPDPLKSKG